MKPEAIDRVQFDAGTLMRDHPPQWHHPNKRAIFDLICSTNEPFAGRIVYARWPERPLPESVTVRGDLEFHAFDQAGVAIAADAYQHYIRMASSTPSVPELLQTLVEEKFQWGESDGN